MGKNEAMMERSQQPTLAKIIIVIIATNIIEHYAPGSPGQNSKRKKDVCGVALRCRRAWMPGKDCVRISEQVHSLPAE